MMNGRDTPGKSDTSGSGKSGISDGIEVASGGGLSLRRTSAWESSPTPACAGEGDIRKRARATASSFTLTV